MEVTTNAASSRLRDDPADGTGPSDEGSLPDAGGNPTAPPLPPPPPRSYLTELPNELPALVAGGVAVAFATDWVDARAAATAPLAPADGGCPAEDVLAVGLGFGLREGTPETLG